MAARALLLPLAVGLLLALWSGAAPARAATVLGSEDPTGPPDGFTSCFGCAPGSGAGLRQLALQGATLEAPEPGVLVSARVHARRTGGTEQPRIAVLRPVGGIAAEIVATAPLPVSASGGRLEERDDLHLPVEAGDSLGFLFRSGEVDVGVRARPEPDGALVMFALPCAPCGSGGRTGVELLLDGAVEPDVDGDLLGDESQDPDGGGSFEDEEELDDEAFLEDLDDLEPEVGGGRRKRLRLLRIVPERDGGATLILAAPSRGRLQATATIRRRRTVASGRAAVARAGRVRLRLGLRPGARRLMRNGPLPARLVVAFRRRGREPQVVARRIVLGRTPERRGAAGLK
jgi:hypothetical protein